MKKTSITDILIVPKDNPYTMLTIAKYIQAPKLNVMDVPLTTHHEDKAADIY